MSGRQWEKSFVPPLPGPRTTNNRRCDYLNYISASNLREITQSTSDILRRKSLNRRRSELRARHYVRYGCAAMCDLIKLQKNFVRRLNLIN